MLNLKGTFSNGEKAMVVHTWEGKRILGHLVTLCHTRSPYSGTQWPTILTSPIMCSLLVILVIALEGRTVGVPVSEEFLREVKGPKKHFLT